MTAKLYCLPNTSSYTCNAGLWMLLTSPVSPSSNSYNDQHHMGSRELHECALGSVACIPTSHPWDFSVDSTLVGSLENSFGTPTGTTQNFRGLTLFEAETLTTGLEEQIDKHTIIGPKMHFKHLLALFHRIKELFTCNIVNLKIHPPISSPSFSVL